MLDQAYKLRQLALDAAPASNAVSEIPPTIVVVGGKGGVGTTTVAVNLAAALAQGGRRTVLVDAAPNADTAQMLGIEVDRGTSLADVLAGNCTAAAALHNGPAGVLLLAGEWVADRTTTRSNKSHDRLSAILQSLADQADAIVVDAGTGTYPGLQSLWPHAPLALVVTTPDDVAVVDSYATIKHCLQDEDVDLRILVNQCQDTATALDVQSRLTTACRRFMGRKVGRAPLLPKHLAAVDAGGAALAWDAPASPFARNVHQLGRFAADLLSRHEPAQRAAREYLTC